MTELKPCPFCGSEWVQVRWIGFSYGASAYEPGYRGECADCFAMTRVFLNPEDAKEAWNRRATYDKD